MHRRVCISYNIFNKFLLFTLLISFLFVKYNTESFTGGATQAMLAKMHTVTPQAFPQVCSGRFLRHHTEHTCEERLVGTWPWTHPPKGFLGKVRSSWNISIIGESTSLIF